MDQGTQLLALDLFSGCGGLTQGLKEAGFEVVAAIEFWKSASKVYRANHPTVRVIRADIRRINPESLQRVVLGDRKLHLIAACPPCQGFSRLRTRNGSMVGDDERNTLLHQVTKFAVSLKPTFVLVENVPPLLESTDYAKFKSDLEAAGYAVQARVDDAADYGVPQRRRRAIIVASLGEFPVRPTKDARVTVRDAIFHLPSPGSTGDPMHDWPESRKTLTIERIKRIPKDGGSRVALPDDLVLACHKESTGFKDVYGRMAWDSPAPTITSGCFNPSKGRFLHPEQNRCITLREAALLQSFPNTYHFGDARSKQEVALMIGNALPPAFIKKQAECIAESIKSNGVVSDDK